MAWTEYNVSGFHHANGSNLVNMSVESTLDFEDDSPFKHLHVQIVFILLYSLVFLGCIMGNLLVIFVIIKHRRMRNITNFFLANLAVADFCVGVFCVIPNLVSYFTSYWLAGQVMCKLYFFIQCVSYTVSIIILTVISMERYFAIIHPMASRRLSRMKLMRVIIVLVWVLAIAYSIPLLIAYDTVSIPENGGVVYFCANFSGMNLKVMSLINFGLWYCAPLLLMTFMYTKVAIVLWKSSCQQNIPGQSYSSSRRLLNTVNVPSSEISNSISTERYESSDSSNRSDSDVENLSKQQSSMRKSLLKTLTSNNPLTSRRKVIRLLLAIVISFALCMLPQHVRLLYEMWAPARYPSYIYRFVPPTSFLLFYLNSCLNPVLYAFLSENFRKSLKEVLACKSHVSRIPGVNNSRKNNSSKHTRHTMPTEL